MLPNYYRLASIVNEVILVKQIPITKLFFRCVFRNRKSYDLMHYNSHFNSQIKSFNSLKLQPILITQFFLKLFDHEQHYRFFQEQRQVEHRKHKTKKWYKEFKDNQEMKSKDKIMRTKWKKNTSLVIQISIFLYDL